MKGHIPEGKILITEYPRQKQIGSIYIPIDKKAQREGRVEIGSEQVDAACDIYFRAKARTIKLIIDKKEYLLINERDILYIK